jgi:tetratricopeptide (TPR) repeat protein/class 3 adenylate cyclase
MRILIPDFIMNKYQQNEFDGSMDAYVLNADLKGFTALTEASMRQSYSGVEVLIDTIKSIFSPALTAVENRGGFVTGFAGDAFTAIFPEGNAADVISAAIEMRDFIILNSRKQTEFGEFELSVRIGVAVGKVEWNIIKTEVQSAFWFSGEGINLAVEAQGTAQSNEVIADRKLCLELNSALCSFQEIDEHFYRINGIIKVPEKPVYQLKRESYSPFLPEAITSMTSEGEFREVVPCFVNLAVPEKAQIGNIIRAMRNLGGFLSNIECTDKGWVLYAIFGAPLEYEKSALRAIEFALDVQSYCGNNVRIGMTRGMVFAGFVGSQFRSEYAALGMAVNLAARFMTRAQWGEVWFDEEVQKAVCRSVAYDELGELSFKGYPQPVPTYRLLYRHHNSTSGFYQSGFIGRNDELSKLAASTQPVKESKFAGVSYIYGDAGQGKSRLVYELVQKMGESIQCFYLQADSIHKSSLNPFANWIRQQFSSYATGDIVSRREDFRKHWSEFSGKVRNLAQSEQIYRELERIESVIAGLIGLEWEGSIYANLEPKYRPTVTGFALKSLLEAYCQFKPVIMVIEDLQWLDSESEETITILTRRADSIPYKLILTARPLDYDKKPVIKLDKDVPVEEIDLVGLNCRQIASFIEGILNRSADTELVDYAFSISQGNPFIAEQFAIYLLESGYLMVEDGHYHLKEQTEKLPVEVQSMLMVRLDRLEAELKRTVLTASVLGCEFASAVLNGMLETLEQRTENLNEMIVQSQLHAGEQEHIWHAVNAIRYIFSHSLLRDAAYSMQLKKQLKNLHLIAGQIMEKQYAEDKSKCGEIAFHFDYAGDWLTAVRFYLKAGDYEKELYHFEASIQHYQKVLAINRNYLGKRNAETALTLQKIGHVNWGKGEHDTALSYFEQALSIREEVFGRCHANVAESLNSIATMYCAKGQYDKALEIYQQALSIWREVLGSRHPDTAISLNNIGNVYDATGDYDQALNFYEQALSIRQEFLSELHPDIATSFNNIGDVYDHKGEYSKALTYYQKALSIRVEILGNRHPNTAISLNCIADVYSETGEFDQAISYYEQALSIRKEALGDRHAETAYSLNNMGNVHDNMGEFDNALMRYAQAFSILLDVFGDKHPETATALNNIGCAYDHKGEYDLALPYYQQALSIWLEVLGERHPETAASLNNIGCVYENKGELDQALPYYQQALSIFQEVIGERSPEASVGLVNIGCIYDTKGEYGQALDYYQRALQIRQEIFGEKHPATLRTLNYIANLYEKMGDTEKASDIRASEGFPSTDSGF